MAHPGFFNDNAYRAYPFQRGTVGKPSGSPDTLKLPFATIVDAGFILGPESGFNAAEHVVFLSKIERTISGFTFEFSATSPTLADVVLQFLLEPTSDEYTRGFRSSAIPVYALDSQSDPLEEENCGEPFWTGYVVFGDISELELQMSVGEIWEGAAEAAIIEPALIQDLTGSQVVSVNLANGDRTRAQRAEGCEPYEWDFEIGGTYPVADCLSSEIVFRAGRNMVLSQSEVTNSISLAIGLGAGTGPTCEELPIFEGETGPIEAENDLLGGDFYCTEAFRTVNGLQGPNVQIFAGVGVSVVEIPSFFKILIDVSLTDLSLCDFSETSDSMSA